MVNTGTDDLAFTTLPVGFSEFAALRRLNKIYVDKTSLIYDMCKTEKFLFLSRPRRFGKTLLVNTVHALFADGVRDFSELAIAPLWKDHVYPVVHFDFISCRSFNTFAGFASFVQKFEDQIYCAVENAGFHLPSLGELGSQNIVSALDRMLQLLDPGSRLVVLVDEYDAPLNEASDNAEIYEAVRCELSSFFDVLKKHSSKFRLLFITGICRHSDFFSGADFVRDISMDQKYGALLGYTRAEIRQYFLPYLKRAAAILNLSIDDCLEKMAGSYDGYCFSEDAATHVFNPWSVMNFLDMPEKGFKNYWYESAGSPAELLKHLKSHALRSPGEYGKDQIVPPDLFNSSRASSKLDDLALLLQAGYLTIKGRHGHKRVILNYPDAEVADSMGSLYGESLVSFEVQNKIYDCFLKDDLESLVKCLNALMQEISDQALPVTGVTVLRALIAVSVIASGHRVLCERPNSLGRSDLEIEADDYLFVIELKFARKEDSVSMLLEQAVRQIRDNRYGEEAGSGSKKLVRYAMVYSQVKKLFEAYARVDPQEE